MPDGTPAQGGASLLLAPTPPSASDLRELGLAPSDFRVASLRDLRRLGFRQSLQLLRGSRFARVIVTGAPDELDLLGDYLVCLAWIATGDQRRVLRRPGDEHAIDARRALSALWRIGTTTLATAGAVVAGHLQAARLRNAAPDRRPLHRPRRCLYLRPTLTFGPPVGGAAAHVAGVVTALVERGIEVALVTAAPQPLVCEKASQTVVPLTLAPSIPFEVNQLRYQDAFLKRAARVAEAFRPDFIYQRYALNDLSGVLLARRLAVPLLLEFNGSEVWTQRNWGSALWFEGLSRRFETLNMRLADWVITVSEPLVDQALSIGADPARLICYPNGVDPDLFDPGRFGEADRKEVRRRLGIPVTARLFTFVGTFGTWHGTEVFARAIRRILDEEDPAAARAHVTHYLFVGDGPHATLVRNALGETGGRVTLAGVRPAADTPGILAASDVLVSPHVPNTDGTPFFGSPTKLFEYMAMERLIVASDLDQIGRVLRGWRPGEPPPPEEAPAAALLARPGDVDSLAEALRRAAAMPEPEARAIGRRARDLALRGLTWKRHADAILAAASEGSS